MEINNNNIDRPVDNDPVECCAKCKSLALVSADNHITNNKVICNSCGEENNIEVLDNIYDYIDNYGILWNAHSCK